MPTPPDSPDGLIDLANSAKAMHTLFMSFVEAGFARPEALYLVGQILTGGLKIAQQPPTE